jgi:periplasmic protein TonB
MFEQTIIESPGLLRRPVAMTISFAGQAGAAVTALLVSLVHTDSLPRPFFLTPVVAPPGTRARPASLTKTVATLPAASRPLRVFREPATIPAGVAERRADTILLAGDDSEVDVPGVPGGIVPFGQSLGTIGGPLYPPAPPLAQPSHVSDPPLEKQAASIPNRPVAVSQGVQAAKLLRQVNPAYPALARQARISGTVRLTAIIGRDGAIRNLEVLSGHPLLTAAALDAVKQWLYQPTLLNREPVEVITQIDVNFTLSH